MALGDVIARLSVSLGLETAAFEKGAKRAAQQTQTLGSKMTKIAGVIGTAFVASIGVDTVRAWADATKGALEYAGSLGETAQQLGVTTDELQEFRYVATQTGIAQDQMDKALQKTTRTLGELATPTKAQAEAMKELGLSAKELEGLGTGDFIALLGDKFKGLTAAQQAALGAQLGLGRSFQTMIPLLNEGTAGIEKMRKAAHDLGIVISQQAIDNADANADLLTTYEKLAKAQETATLTQPENVKAYLAYQKAITDLKLVLYEAIGVTAEFISENGKLNTVLRDFGKNTGIQDFFKNFNTTVSDWAKRTHDAIASTISGIRHWLGDVFGSITSGAIGKIKELGASFAWLYDVVIGHSYIPDMVDGIAAHMARLDAVMVKPAQIATEAAGKEFQDLRDLMDRLFPEVGKAADFNADLARIKGSALNDNQQDEAVNRLWREFTGAQGNGSIEPDFGGSGPLVQGIDETKKAIEGLTQKSKVGTVQIAKSFADMATSTLQSLGQMAQAIKGGGFLDILTSVANVALQLGQAGAFGSKVSTFLNTPYKPPAYANGTNFHPGGLALVGERRPEVVELPRGSKVHPSTNGFGGATINVYANDAVLADTVRGWVAEGMAVAAKAGAKGGVAKIQRIRDRALA
jgi:hypothetical protein